MKAYVQFFYDNTYRWNNSLHKTEIVNPYKAELLGSDGVFILDARNSLAVQIQDAKNRVQQLKNVQSHISGFEIRYGDLKNSRTVYQSWTAERNKAILDRLNTYRK